MTFARLVLRIPGDTGITVTNEELRVQFLEYLRKLGYPARGAESLVFDQDESNRARFALGGTVNELECTPAPAMPSRRCRIGISWEVLDRANDRVTYRTTTRHLTTSSDSNQLATELVWGAFYSLLARSKFVEAFRIGERERPERPSYERSAFRRCESEPLRMPQDASKALAATVLVRCGEAMGTACWCPPMGSSSPRPTWCPHPTTLRCGYRAAANIAPLWFASTLRKTWHF